MPLLAKVSHMVMVVVQTQTHDITECCGIASSIQTPSLHG